MTEVQSAGRDQNGRFTAGNPGGPGRPKKETERAILDAITNAIPPEQIGEAMRTALDLAIELKSPRGIVAVLELQAAYGIGKPTIRVENTGELDPMSATIEKLKQAYYEAQVEALQQAQSTPGSE